MDFLLVSCLWLIGALILAALLVQVWSGIEAFINFIWDLLE